MGKPAPKHKMISLFVPTETWADLVQLARVIERDPLDLAADFVRDVVEDDRRMHEERAAA